MNNRVGLHTIFCNLLGSNNVYFQPPETVKLKYPCIIYDLDDVDTLFASNLPYKQDNRYRVTVIDRDPDSEIPKKVGQLPLTAFITRFSVDRLNHTVYTIYY